MLDRLLDASVRFRWVVIALTLLVAAYGAYQLFRLPIDAVPDITNKQVQINTQAPALGPLDMERLVTFPVETAMAGIPGLESTRSISRNGFSQVTVNLLEGALLVAAVLFWLLGNIRAAIIATLVIPLSFLFTQRWSRTCCGVRR
jgi:Cu/Ag efflux pump CusA